MTAGAPPRVLLLAPHFPPEAGAAATRLASLAAGLRLNGHDVRVACPSPSYLVPAAAERVQRDEPWVRRVAVTPRGRGALANAVHQFRLSRALRRVARAVLLDFEAEVVVVSSPPPVAALAGLGLRDRSGRRLPVVLDVRDIWPDVLVQAGALTPRGPATWLLRLVERRLLRGAAALATVTTDKVRLLAARTSAPVVLVPNGVDEAWAQGGPPATGGGGEGEEFVVLHAGNVGRAQDVGLLVRAVALLAERTEGRRVRALVVGDGEELAAVRGLASSLGAPVTFLPVEPRAAVRERLATCGCAFVTLRTAQLTDAVPSKLLDAMARGVPVVLAGAGESAGVVQASGGGLVVPPGEPQALAQALGRLAQSSASERLAMGELGRRHVLANFRREDAAKALSGLLVSVVAAAQSAAGGSASRAPA